MFGKSPRRGGRSGARAGACRAVGRSGRAVCGGGGGGAEGETVLKWVAGYGPPVVVGLVLGACVLYIVRQLADLFIENRISLAFRDREPRLESRSAFEDRVLEERCKVFHDIRTRLVSIPTDLSPLRGGKDPVQEPFLRDGELVPL